MTQQEQTTETPKTIEPKRCLSCGAVVHVDENGELPEGLPCGH